MLRTTPGGGMRLDELLLAEIWQAQWLSGVLTTTENRMVRVVYRGIWTHRRGPDFAGALLDLGGELKQGDIELHLRASDWYAHGHHDDPAYEAVVLHVVWEDDLDEPVRRRDGQRVPTLVLHDSLAGPLELFPRQHVRPLGALGFEHCAPHLAAAAPDQLHRLFEEAGDRRLREKVARVQARLAGEPPAQTLYWMLADALGYHRNREGMRAVAEAVPIAELEARLLTLSPDDRFPTAAGLLLGTAGFLPVSDRERGLSGLRSDAWRRIESVWRATNPVLLRTTWRLDGVRPTNHPLRRLLSLAGLVATSCEGILGACLARLQSEPARRRLLEWLTGGPVPLGRDRAHEVIVNVVVPFALAYAEWTEDAALAERAAQLWEELPAGRGNALVEATLEQVCGTSPLRLRSARAEQGVLHLHWWGCRQRRCYECPIAQLVTGIAASEPAVPGAEESRAGSP
ncbi:MAG: DUF2851 family protein [Thermomicrobium sp.]|nr:DUF2851 family protein [Thermomicrobium sp.]